MTKAERREVLRLAQMIRSLWDLRNLDTVYGALARGHIRYAIDKIRAMEESS